MGRTLLLTGRPGIGKTTVIKEVAARLGNRAGGFCTEEIRDQRGRRKGFRLVTLDGDEAVMAHTDLHSEGRPEVGRYGVDLAAIDEVGVGALRRAMASDLLVIVDEVGKMELFSEAFRRVVRDAVIGPSPVLGTVMRGAHPWVDKLRMRPEVEVWVITAENRDGMAERIWRWIDVDARAK